jgi:hypothetical protein
MFGKFKANESPSVSSSLGSAGPSTQIYPPQAALEEANPACRQKPTTSSCAGNTNTRIEEAED